MQKQYFWHVTFGLPLAEESSRELRCTGIPGGNQNAPPEETSMLQEAPELLGVLPTQVCEIFGLMVAALGIALVKKILHTYVGDDLLFGILPVKYLFDLGHVALFAKLLWILLSA